LDYLSPEDNCMMKRLTFGFLFALTTAPALMAAPSIPGEAASRIPWQHLAAAAADALCTYVGLGC
jgi:hypothetical protein